MFTRISLLILTLTFFCGNLPIVAAHKRQSARIKPKAKLIAVKPQDAVKINPNMTQLSPKFYGHDEIILFKNLQTRSKQNAGKIKGKAVYGNLTTDDYFAINISELSSDQNLIASTRDNIRYIGDVWRIRNADEFPQPELVYTGGCGHGSGRGSFEVSSRDELFVPFSGASKVWRGGVFPLRTELPRTSRKNYKGYNVGENCKEFYVPLRQIHYGLSFLTEQPLKLINVTNANRFAGYESGEEFSLDSYDYETRIGSGFVIWRGNDVVSQDNSDYLSTLFIVKLAAPYIASKTFTKLDKVEGKQHVAVQNKLLVNIAAVWLYNGRTGEIISKGVTDKP